MMIISELISELEEVLKKEGDIKVIIRADWVADTIKEYWATGLMTTTTQIMDWCGENEKYFVISADI